MTTEEFQALTARIVQNLDNQALVSELLTQATDVFRDTVSQNEQANVKMEEYEGKVKQLQETNMNLFLRVSQPTPQEPLQKTAPLQYDDLIADLGGM